MTDARDLTWLEHIPAGSLIPVDAVREALRAIGATGATAARPSLDSWRERLWSAPAETRIGVRELAAAVGHSPSWIWKRTSQGKGTTPIPHKKRDGELVFVVGEVRDWLRAQEIAPTTVLWIGLDEPLGDIARRGIQEGADNDRLLVMEERPASTQQFGEIIKSHAVEVAIIDTLSDLWLGFVSQEKDAGEVQAFLRPYVRIAREVNCALVLLHHLPKAEGSTYRGSTALGASVDILATLKPVRGSSEDGASDGDLGDDDGRRVLSVRGRGGIRETLPLSFDGQRYELGERPLPISLRILRALSDGPLSSNDLVDLLGGRRATVLQEVQSLRGSGYVMEGGGRGGWRISDSGRFLLRSGEGRALHLTGTTPEPVREPLHSPPEVYRNHSGTTPEPLGNQSGTTGGSTGPRLVPDREFLSPTGEPPAGRSK